MGCGDAHLIGHLARTLPAKHPDRIFEFYGFEVGDVGWHGDDYLARTVAFLNEQAPGYPWHERIAVLSASGRWPYPDAGLQIIVSNQVLEHVQEHAFVFQEIRRCLAPAGVSFHLFPLREQIFEFHAHMPIVHWAADAGTRRSLMLLFAKLGFRRRYELSKEFHGWKNLEEFAAGYSDILGRMTNHKSARQITDLAEAAGFKTGFYYTKDFFWSKLLSLMQQAPKEYGAPVSTWVDDAAFPLLKRIASVTLTLR